MATQLESVDALLGLPAGTASSPLDLAHSIVEGLPVGAVDRIARAVAPGDSHFKWRIVPKATLERRRKARSRLTTEEGNRVSRLLKVYSLGLEIYQDPAKVQAFLTRPHMMLDGETPLEVALATGPGADLVVNLLGRAAYGGGV